MHVSQRDLFLRHVAQTSPAPLMLEIEHAEGIYLYDTSGKKYIDLISGISVSNSGHCHPKVVAAVKKQADLYMHLMVYGEYIQSPQVKLAKKISDILNREYSVYFVNSGAEAVEGAIKLARRATGRQKIVSLKGAYHGSTTGALSLMSEESLTVPFGPLLPGVVHIEPEDLHQLNQVDSGTACIIIEPVRGEAGAVPLSDEYLKAIEKRCRQTGTLLVADEIQCGYGRTGPFFSFMTGSFQPDIIVVAKGMGGGLPVGAFIAEPHIMKSLSENPALGHITTFGGNAVCCAAALANTEVILDLNTPENVPKLEKIIRKKLQHPKIKSITGKGLLLGIEFENAELNQRLISKCISEGIITDWFLFSSAKMRIAPPLVITEPELENACEKLLEIIDITD